MRSVVSALSSIIRTGHLVVSDFPYDDAMDRARLQQGAHSSPVKAIDTSMRVAQTPRWLDFGKVGCGRETPTSPAIQLVTHSDIFHLPSGTSNSDEQLWRDRALPSFNSKAIESRLGWIPGMVR